MNLQRRLFGLVLASLLLVGTAAVLAEVPAETAATGDSDVAQTTQPADAAPVTGVTRAIATLQPTAGHDVRGTVTFLQVDGGIQVVASITGLAPGNHGFHVHEYGDCSAPDGTSAGGHFNPHQVSHGGPETEPRHVGDLGNVHTADDGTTSYDWTDTVISFEGTNSILGRGLIVHEGEDDLTSQPTGAAGARVACGVIGVAAAAE